MEGCNQKTTTVNEGKKESVVTSTISMSPGSITEPVAQTESEVRGGTALVLELDTSEQVQVSSGTPHCGEEFYGFTPRLATEGEDQNYGIPDSSVHHLLPNISRVGRSMSEGYQTPPNDIWQIILQSMNNMTKNVTENLTTIKESQNSMMEIQNSMREVQNSMREEQNSMREEQNAIKKSQNSMIEIQNSMRDELKGDIRAIERSFNKKLEEMSFEVDNRIKSSALQVKNEVVKEVESQLARVTQVQQACIQQIESLANTQDQMQAAINSVKTNYPQLPQEVANLTREVEKLKIKHKDTIDYVEELGKAVKLQEFENNTNLAEKCIQQHRTYTGEFEKYLQERESDVITKVQSDLKEMEKRIKSELTDNQSYQSNTVTAPYRTPNCISEVGQEPIAQSSKSSNQVPPDEKVKPPYPEQGLGTEILTPSYRNVNKAHSVDPVPIVIKVVEDENTIKYRQFRRFNPSDRQANPVVFIRAFAPAFPSTWTEERKIQFVIGYLDGEAASWGPEAGERCLTYQEFEGQFLAKYWSLVEQQRVRRQIFNPPPYNRKKGTLRAYFEKFIRQARHFTFPVSEIDLLQVLKSRLPPDIIRALALVPDTNVSTFLSALDALDLSYEQGINQIWSQNCQNTQVGNGNYPNNNSSYWDSGNQNQNHTQFHHNQGAPNVMVNAGQNNNSNPNVRFNGYQNYNNSNRRGKNRNVNNQPYANTNWHPYRQPNYPQSARNNNSMGNQGNFRGNQPGNQPASWQNQNGTSQNNPTPPFRNVNVNYTDVMGNPTQTTPVSNPNNSANVQGVSDNNNLPVTSWPRPESSVQITEVIENGNSCHSNMSQENTQRSM